MSRIEELQQENQRLREANRRLQLSGPALERDKLIISLRTENDMNKRIFNCILCILFTVCLWASAQGQTPGTSDYPTSLDTATTLMTQVNSCSTTLNGGINNSVTSITVNTQTCFPSTGIFVIDSEYMIYTASTSTSFTVTRASFGSAAATHSSGAAVRMTVMAAYHNVLKDAVISAQTKVGYGSSTPTNGKFLVGNTSAGTSQWRVLATGDIPDLSATYQPTDADLTALAALSSTGVIARTAANTYALRTVTAGDGIALTNGDGVSGNPTVALDINSLTTETSIASGDYVAIYDVSASALRKMTRANFISGLTSGAATAALDNLASVSINTALIPQSGVDLGAAATPFKDLYIYGSGTFGSHSIKFTGTPTGNRVITIPNATTTMVGTDVSQTLDNKTLANTNSFSGYFDATRISAPSNPASGSLRLFANNTTGKLACLDNSGADCMPSSGGGGSGTVNTGASGNFAYYPSAGTTVDDVPGMTADSSGDVTIAPSAASSGSPTLITVTGPAHTTLAASTEATDLNFNLARTMQFSGGALTLQRQVRFQAPTISFSSASTVTDMVMVDIASATAGTNATFTRNTTLRLKLTNAADHGYWVDAQTGATGDLGAMGIAGTKVVFFRANNGKMNSVFGSGTLTTTSTDGFMYMPTYVDTDWPTGSATSINSLAACQIQNNNITGYYALWCYLNSGWHNLTPIGAAGIGTPTISGGSGAGTSPTVSVAGRNEAHEVTVTTGTSPGTSATVVTVTFNNSGDSFPTAPYCTFAPSNSNAAALSGTGQVYIGSRSTTTYTIDVGSTALAASTQYKWNAKCFR